MRATLRLSSPAWLAQPRNTSSTASLSEGVPSLKEAVEEVFLGCANQAGEDNRNVARMALLLADYPGRTHRVEAGGAEPVERQAGHPLGIVGEQERHAGDVAARWRAASNR
jgi:hypothetical protein